MATVIRSKVIADDVLAVLREASVLEGNMVRLNSGQLNRDLYMRVNDVLTRLGGKWKGGKTAAHVFDRDPGPLLAEVLSSGKKPAKNPLDFFPTPAPVAQMMLDRAKIPTEQLGAIVRVLEPSAGEGAIADYLLYHRRTAIVTCVEIDPVRAEVLGEKGYAVTRADFLSLVPGRWKEPFDRVLMNPPFTAEGNATAYVDHVRHAYGFLAQEGRLVAVCPAGFTFAPTAKLTAFRDWVAARGTWLNLEEASFRTAGTNCNTCLIVIDKPIAE